MRPRKKVRDLAGTRRVILDAAFGEIHAHGFHATSLDAILEDTHLTKGALFHQFDSKVELGYAVVDEVIGPMTQARWVDPIAAFEDPLQGILHLVQVNIGEAPQAMLNLGCPLNNLIQEVASSDREFRRRLGGLVEQWIEGIALHVERGQASGHVGKSASPRSVAEYVVMSIEGGYSVIKALGDKSALPSLLSSMEAFFACVAQDRARR